MIVFVSIALLTHFVSWILGNIKYCNESFNDCKIRVISAVISCVLYLGGFILYLIVTDFSSYSDCEDKDVCYEFKVYAGLVLTGVMTVVKIIIEIGSGLALLKK